MCAPRLASSVWRRSCGPIWPSARPRPARKSGPGRVPRRSVRPCIRLRIIRTKEAAERFFRSPCRLEYIATSNSTRGAQRMDRISIVGGKHLNGNLPISGAKNAALPLMIASLLTPDRLTLKNVPNLADVNTLARILRNHGVDLAVDGKRADPSPYLGETFHLTARDIVDTTAPYEMVSRMRASFWVLGPLLARCRQARVSMPGGCAIGTRPVDLHLMGLKALGAEIDIDGGYVVAKAPRGLRGARIAFPKVSVGATHAVLMACSLAKGDTVIENAAREPEIGDVAECLIKMGAKIEGVGTTTLRIQGASRLEGAVHTVLPDRIETGTYAFAVAAAGGDVELRGARRSLLETAFAALQAAGA